MKIGNKEFDTDNKTYICGILNVTPDSFSDGNRFNSLDKALYHTQQMINDGADIIDVGGESTRPGYKMISCEEETERVCPVIEAITERFDIPVSIDTYKPEVFESACRAGALMLNDIWGLRRDARMAGLVKDMDAAVCIMHNEKEMIKSFDEVLKGISESLKIAETAGISKDRICIDPGVGFAKSYEMNLDVLNDLDRLKVFGLPVYLGCSRKSVIGLTLGLAADQRLEGTIATSVIGVMKGASFIRVHDVRENFLAVKMARAVLNRG